jgi:hypothetical protein
MVEAQTPWLGDWLCTSGDHERGLLAPLCHCLTPRGGGVFLSSRIKIHDTQSREKKIVHQKSFIIKTVLFKDFFCWCY